MFKPTAVPPAGPYHRQARRRLNMALDFVGQTVVTPRIHARDVGLVVGSWSVRAESAVGPAAGHPERVDGNFRSAGRLRSYVAFQHGWSQARIERAADTRGGVVRLSRAPHAVGGRAGLVAFVVVGGLRTADFRCTLGAWPAQGPVWRQRFQWVGHKSN